MPDARAPTGTVESQLTEGLHRVSPLIQIEGHEWSPQAWKVSKQLLDRTEADLSLARGRLVYERFLRSGPGGFPAPGADGSAALPMFQNAARLYRELNDSQGEREALFWVGTLEQVINRNFPAALEALHRSSELARAGGDSLVLSCVERHLGFIDLLEGRPSEGQRHLEESVRLRRELGFAAGVAMGLVALAEFFLESHDPDRARRVLDEASSIARENGATGALQAIELARGQLQ